MARIDVVADLTPPHWDSVPTWLTAVLSVLGTIGGWKALGPLAKWAGKRIEIMQQVRIAERAQESKQYAADRAEFITQLTSELRAAREELIETRRDLGEEIELRMAVVIENTGLRRDVEHLTKALADDKRDCQRAIRRLEEQIRDLRRLQGGQPA